MSQLLRLAVMFGGKTLEHEVSIITGVQCMKHADSSKYEIIPVYIDKAGLWWTGNELKNIEYFQQQDLMKPTGLQQFNLIPMPNKNEIDVAILCFHGRPGEAGAVQGVLTLAEIPFQGPEILGSAVCFDKIATRQVLQAENIPQTKYTWFTQHEWENKNDEVQARLQNIALPWFVKPANSGSSIGVVKVSEASQLDKALEEVFSQDYRVIVEEEVTGHIEVNVSVCGNQFGEITPSVSEQPIKSSDLLSFADKYEKGGKKSGMASASRRIPAPISRSLQTKLQEAAKKLFTLFDLSGVVRIDFFADPTEETYYVTELNTIPGSMSFYLWEATNLQYVQLIDKLVETALDTKRHKDKFVTSFDTNIIKNAKI